MGHNVVGFQPELGDEVVGLGQRLVLERSEGVGKQAAQSDPLCLHLHTGSSSAAGQNAYHPPDQGSSLLRAVAESPTEDNGSGSRSPVICVKLHTHQSRRLSRAAQGQPRFFGPKRNENTRISLVSAKGAWPNLDFAAAGPLEVRVGREPDARRWIWGMEMRCRWDTVSILRNENIQNI